MKTTLDLRNLSEAERDSAVNLCIATTLEGYTRRNSWSAWIDKEGEDAVLPKPYATSADAVLPLLEKQERWDSDFVRDSKLWGRSYCCVVKGYRHLAPTFPLAACYALLAAHGVEVLLGQKTK